MLLQESCQPPKSSAEEETWEPEAQRPPKNRQSRVKQQRLSTESKC